MRESCKTFSTLRTPSAALFYDFNTRQSLDRLELLSQHPVLRNYVHRLIFCRPMFQPWFAEASEYKSQVRHDRWYKHEPPYTRDQEKTGLRAYQAGLRKQRRLLRYGTYKKTCGRCMSRFPLLSSIFISDGVPEAINLDIQFRSNGPTLFQRQHPNVLLKNGFDEYERESADRHVSNVLQALAIANVPIEELVTHNEWGPSQGFSMANVPGWPNGLDLSNLSRLDLCLRDGKRSPSGADWSAAICPLLEQMPALTELYLRFCCRRNEYPTVANLWGLNTPNLTILSVEGLKLTRVAFCDFLRRHNHLRELTLCDVRITDGQWFDIFKVLREHPELEDLDINHVDDGRLDCPISTFGQPELPDDVTLELYDYLHGEADWTDSLSREWR